MATAAPTKLKSWMLDPGVYIFARKIDSGPFGAHQFVVCIPEEDFPADAVRLGAYGAELQFGVTLTGDPVPIDGVKRIRFIPNEDFDLTAVKNFLGLRKPSQKQLGITPRVKFKRLKWKGATGTDAMTKKLIESANYYNQVEKNRPLEYSLSIFSPVTSNTWAQSLIRHNIGKFSTIQDLYPGEPELGASELIDKSYFVKQKAPRPIPNKKRKTRGICPGQARTKPTPGFYYQKRSGETLWSICVSAYKSGQKWKAVAGHPKNRQQIRDPHSIDPGTCIFLPRL